MSCPTCGRELEDYDTLDGGWCSGCEEWFPADIVEERMEEEDLPEEDSEP